MLSRQTVDETPKPDEEKERKRSNVPIIPMIMPAEHRHQPRRARQRAHEGNIQPHVAAVAAGVARDALVRERVVVVDAGVPVRVDARPLLEGPAGARGDVHEG